MFFAKKKIFPQICLAHFLFALNFLFIYSRYPNYTFPLKEFDLLNILYILNFLLGCSFVSFIVFIIWNLHVNQYKEAISLLFHALSLDYGLSYFAEFYTGSATFFVTHPFYLKGAFIYTCSIAWGLSFCIIIFNYIKSRLFGGEAKKIDNIVQRKDVVNDIDIEVKKFNRLKISKEKSESSNINKISEIINDKKNAHLLPNLDLLHMEKKESVLINVEQQTKLLLQTLKDFGVIAIVKDVFIGPVVTLYSIELAPGIKASRVIALSSDISRLMTAFSVRISTIPGKNLLGVEISNPKRQIVYFKEGMLSEKYIKFNGQLPIYLGSNIFGEPEVFDLSNMPHLLVAGTTGSGKSVGIHTILLSLLHKKTFHEVKLILVDPKKLELTPYEDIPNLLLPVVTEPQKAIQALNWAVKEMERRYDLMSKIGVRNISSFNEKIKKEKNILELEDSDNRAFEFIVIVIDELADLMLLVGKEFEMYVQRIAQMGRAAGIHMIIATQRPSVDVITGTIKANFPTRISFKLSTKVDSRTILGDMSGAEQLLGSGDMLYLSNAGKITRIHGGFASEDDVFNVVSFLKKQDKPQYIDLSLYDLKDNDTNCDVNNGDDPYYYEALKLIKHEKKISTSFLQRSFPIGYNRAASLVERMEKEGYVTKGDKFGRNRDIISDNINNVT